MLEQTTPIWQQNCSGKNAASMSLHPILEGPLQAARRTLEQAGLLQRATLLLSDGLEQVDKTDVSHVVIAGMGGETIIHILQPCDWVKQGVQLILQPMTKVPVLRQWLAENGYAILQEQVVKDGKFFITFYGCSMMALFVH